jgi:dTMP kinase
MKTTTASPVRKSQTRFQTKKVTRKKPFFPKDVRPGTLIVVEWQDGSGKSTQVKILQKLLESNGFFVHFTEWNSNPRIKPLTKKLKTEDLSLPATVFDMVHAADLMERYITEIAGMLRAGMIVLCDRYIYTALARGYARGLEIDDLRNFYDQYFPVPDMAFYFRLPVEAGMKRAAGRSELKHYEAGMDMQFSENILHNFHAFQTRVVDAYDTLAESENMYILDAMKPVYETTPEMRRMVGEYFQNKYGMELISGL